MEAKSLKFNFTLYVGLLVVLLSLGIGFISYFSASSAISDMLISRVTGEPVVMITFPVRSQA